MFANACYLLISKTVVQELAILVHHLTEITSTWGSLLCYIDFFISSSDSLFRIVCKYKRRLHAKRYLNGSWPVSK